MERLRFKDIKRYIHAAGPYIDHRADHAYCPDCGHELKLEYRVNPVSRIGSLSISCEVCQRLAYIDRAKKPEWMD